MRGLEGLLFTVGIPMVLVGGFGLARTLLVLIGRLKSPLLRSFEAYTEKPQPYNSLRALAIWLALLQGGLLLTLLETMRLPTIVVVPLVLTVMLGYTAHEWPDVIRERLPFLMPAPGWYADLYPRTTLIERRRIAYMWLRLPRALRHHYNQHDDAFLRWADLVIVGTFS